MTLYQAIKTVKDYQKWRRGEIEHYETKPVSISKAIDLLIKEAEETYENNKRKNSKRRSFAIKKSSKKVD